MRIEQAIDNGEIHKSKYDLPTSRRDGLELMVRLLKQCHLSELEAGNEDVYSMSNIQDTEIAIREFYSYTERNPSDLTCKFV
ncbi:hypothetical protein VTL71DRAFT_3111, partial [Oculimacula yallundae]